MGRSGVEVIAIKKQLEMEGAKQHPSTLHGRCLVALFLLSTESINEEQY